MEHDDGSVLHQLLDGLFRREQEGFQLLLGVYVHSSLDMSSIELIVETTVNHDNFSSMKALTITNLLLNQQLSQDLAAYLVL